MIALEQYLRPLPPRRRREEPTYTRVTADEDFFPRTWSARPNVPKVAIVEPEAVPPSGMACSARLP